MPIAADREWLHDTELEVGAQVEWCLDLIVTSVLDMGREDGHSWAMYCHH